MNEPYSNSYGNFSQTPVNSYPVNNYFRPEEKMEKKETFMTKHMKSQFSFFAPVTILYALFYTFCLYKNTSGITYPFFVVGTFCYFFLCMKKLEVPYKKDSLFYIVSILLLGISNCCTNSMQLLWMNKLGIFLLFFILILHTLYQDAKWSFPKYLGAMLHTIWESVTCLFSPFNDLTSFFDAKKHEKSETKKYISYILIGVAASIPMLTIMITLLCSADIVFRNMINNLFSFNFSFSFGIAFMVIAVFFVSYALLSALCRKRIKEEVTEKKVLEPVIAITVTGMLSAVYLVFSMIQILYLFIGSMKLPEGYTYSAYARQGFFQLLAVCMINLFLVLFCLSFFKDNMILKVILTIISGCTFIMILSSALRMFMYIARYNLTFLRIFVLWALAVIFLLMAGVTIYIYIQRFPLFFYSVAITTVFYIGLSFSHPDYWIARYNLNPAHLDYLNEYDVYDSQRYLSQLSIDAAPILLDANRNPYMPADLETMEKFVMLENKYKNGYSYEIDKIKEEIDVCFENSGGYTNSTYYYYKVLYRMAEEINVRNFNFSTFIAMKKTGLW